MLALIAMVALWVIFLTMAPEGINHVFKEYPDIHARIGAIACAVAVTIVLFYFSVICLLTYVGEPGIFPIF